ncbi:MAG: ABC transporter permease [Bacteroidales bacterium]
MYVTKIISKLRHGLPWFLINLLGLSTAMACVIATLLYIRYELSYDRMHEKASRIYRVTTDSNKGATSVHPARVTGNWPQDLMMEYPAMDKMVRLVPFRKAVVKIGNQSFFCEKAYSTDSTFFDLFDFKLVSGKSENAFAKPGRAMICESLATKYFGSTDVIGREITIIHQQDPNPKNFIIDGVMEDFPGNSHFHAELLTSFTTFDEGTSWAYTYFLMKQGTDIASLRNDIHAQWKKNNPNITSLPIVHFQPLTDIHLYSHKTREMEKNGDIRSLILLGSGAVIILLIALINFLNLSRVQFTSEVNAFRVRLIIGASRFRLALEMAAHSMLLSVLAFSVGLIAALEIGRFLGAGSIQTGQITDLLVIALVFMTIIAVISVLPLFTSGFSTKRKPADLKRNLYAVPLIVQFTLSVIAITSTIALYRQMNYIQNQHPASRNADMLVIADNPWETLQRYETFKTELLNSTSITDVTAAMEEPGGDILDGCNFEMEGIDKNENPSINIFTIDSNFFSLMGISPLAGTVDFGYTPSQQWEADVLELNKLRLGGKDKGEEFAAYEKKVGNYREKYILNQSALNMLGITNPEDAIGKRFRLTFFIPELFPEGEVIGVVPDFHYTNLYSKEKPLAIASRKLFNYCFIIRIDPLQRKKAIETLRNVWQKVNPEYPLQYEYITQSYQKVYTTEYSQSRVISLFALLSMIISSLGIFALAAFIMQRRTKEIGIRKVNGATIAQVMLMLNRDFIKWVILAFIIACPIAWYAMHKWLQSFAYKTALSWWVFAAAGAVAVAVALLTVSWQSWQAATRNPVEALRYE